MYHSYCDSDGRSFVVVLSAVHFIRSQPNGIIHRSLWLFTEFEKQSKVSTEPNDKECKKCRIPCLAKLNLTESIPGDTAQAKSSENER